MDQAKVSKEAKSFWFLVGDFGGTHSLSVHFTKEACLKKFEDRSQKMRDVRYSAVGPFPMSTLDGFDFLLCDIQGKILMQS